MLNHHNATEVRNELLAAQADRLQTSEIVKFLQDFTTIAGIDYAGMIMEIQKLPDFPEKQLILDDLVKTMEFVTTHCKIAEVQNG